MSVSVAETTNVGMAQVRVARDSGQLVAVLGSCVGVAVFHPESHIGALAHVVLPDSGGRGGSPSKYADTVLPLLIQLLGEAGARQGPYVVKLAGGASMFGRPGNASIGEKNVRAILAAAERAGLTIAAKHLGGGKGRRVMLDCATGNFTVQIVGDSPILL